MSSGEHALRHRVQWGETDAAGIVFYPNYYRWFDRATHELCRAAGYSIARMLEQGYAVPIIECGARFLSPLRYDDEIALISRVVDLRTRAFRVEHSVRRDSLLVGEGYEVRLWARVEPGGSLRPEPIPEELRNLLTGA